MSGGIVERDPKSPMPSPSAQGGADAPTSLPFSGPFNGCSGFDYPKHAVVVTTWLAADTRSRPPEVSA